MGKDMGGMMKQAQKLQAKMAKVQEELGAKQVEGDAGGGMVVVMANGHQEILSIKIDPEVALRGGNAKFDRRFRLIVSTIINHQPAAVRAIAAHLAETSPEALNAVHEILSELVEAECLGWREDIL